MTAQLVGAVLGLALTAACFGRPALATGDDERQPTKESTPSR